MLRYLALFASLAVATTAFADDTPTFYRCGNVISERPMPACADAVMRERRLEADRAKRAVERAEKERDAQRDLSWWLRQYPNPAAIERERQERLQKLRPFIVEGAAKIADLEQERRRLVEECAFYACGVATPERLRHALEENQAMFSDLRLRAVSAEEEIKRINIQYAWTRAHMNDLWKKAPIESLRASTPVITADMGR